jgi:AcrR family transcriptional regulator
MARPRSDIRARIVASARGLFLSAGVEAASLRSIAEEAGTSIGMIYYYFATKDALFLAAVDEPLETLARDLEASLDPSLSVADRLDRVHARLGELGELESIAVRIVLREALVSAPRLDVLRARLEPLFARVDRMLDDGRSSGVLRDDLPRSVLSLALFGSAVVAPIATALFDGPLRSADHASFSRTYLDGARASSDRTRSRR